MSRLASLTIGLAGTTHDQTLGFAHNPAGQITTNTRSNDTYSFTGLANTNRTDTHNGLNQITATGGTTLAHDARGNITNDGTRTYAYSSENLMTSATGVGTFSYDPLMRMVQSSGSGYRFAYDGAVIAEEYNGSGARIGRYVHGPGVDEPLVWYDNVGARRFLQADERGSIVATSTDTAAAWNIATYDEYGQPGQANLGRFGYTGQAWLPEAGLHYYKARMYNPALGRFMQTDPIGYASGMNLYSYVRGDPVNLVDPTGLQEECPPDDPGRCIEVEGRNPQPRRTCSAGYTLVGNICILSDLVQSIVWGNGYFTFVAGTTPILDPRTPCTADGNVVTCSAPPPEQCLVNSTTVENGTGSGPLIFVAGGGEGYLVGGGGVSAGGFWDLGTDNVGAFAAGESWANNSNMGSGLGASLGLQVGVATNLASFAGDYSVIGFGVGPISFNYAFARGDFFSPISFSAGPSINILTPKLPVSGHLSHGRTQILFSTAGRCP